jgi:hypothetical protein
MQVKVIVLLLKHGAEHENYSWLVVQSFGITCIFAKDTFKYSPNSLPILKSDTPSISDRGGGGDMSTKDIHIDFLRDRKDPNFFS